MMTPETKPVSITSAQFIQFAGKDLQRWRLIVDLEINHPFLGKAKIIQVEAVGQEIILHVLLNHANPTSGGKADGVRKFNQLFLERCEVIALPEPLVRSIFQSISDTSKKPPETRLPVVRSGGKIVEVPINSTVLTNQRSSQNQDEQASHRSYPGETQLANSIANRSQTTAQFGLGQEVALRQEPKQRGMISAPAFYSQGEWQYEVFFSAGIKRIYREKDLIIHKAKEGWIQADEMLRNLALTKLNRPLSDNLYALYGSRTQFEVYQFKPALKFLANPDQRLLIADEVGLGKTIEAGIIYLELQARLALNRVLVICPSALRMKWQDEMKLRFDEEFSILDMQGIQRFYQQYRQIGDAARLRGIVSLELIRRRELVDEIEAQRINFDLVIIDEAHHCRNTGTLSYNFATVVSDNADAMLLLTATPLQMGNQDLFNLLRILAPGEFDDYEAFLSRLEPNQYVNRASQILGTGNHYLALTELRKVERTQERERFTGNPYYKEVIRMLSQSELDRKELVSTQRRMIELNTLATVFTRTRKREIAEKVPTRAAFTLTVQFTPPETQFYNAVIRGVREEFLRLGGSNYASGWVSIMRERQTASCISAARRRFAEIAKSASPITPEEEAFLDPSILGEWQEEDLLRGRSTLLNRYPSETAFAASIDSKYEKFILSLRKVLAEDDYSKVIVFSFFRDTIEYLYQRLIREEVGVLRLHGGFKVFDRQGIIDQFRSDPKIRVLISSDVGAEGLDFQFCNTLYNYDLPWNPMKVEQRIGRIDRFGQQSPRIRIYNLVIENSVESRIMMRLYERIGIFQQSIGDIEAILGEEIRELSRRVYTAALTPDEEMRLADHAAQNILRRQQELEEFEKHRLQFMGQEAIFSTLVNQAIDSGSFVSEHEVRSLVQTFMEEVFEHSRLECNDCNDGSYCLVVNDDLTAYMQRFVLQNKRSDQTAQEFLKLLSPGKEIPLTFTDQLAYERKLLEFITLRHPLVQAAVDFWKDQIDPVESTAFIGLQSDAVQPGEYFFFLFALDARGAEASNQLVAVVMQNEAEDVSDALSEQFLRLVQTSLFQPRNPPPRQAAEQLEARLELARKFMTRRRDEIEQEILRSNDALVNARLAALRQSYEAKRRRVQEGLDKASEARIRRMKEGQLRNMAVKYELDTRRVEERRSVSVGFSLVLKGIVRVMPGGLSVQVK